MRESPAKKLENYLGKIEGKASSNSSSDILSPRPDLERKNVVFAFQNNKGGVGKTMLSFNIMGAMVEAGAKVLVIDFDEQGDITKLMLGRSVSDDRLCADSLLLREEVDIADVVIEAPISGAFLIPGGHKLKGLENSLASNPDALFYFQEKIKRVRGEYDFIIIDLPTMLNWTVRSAFAVADRVIIPVLPELTAIVNAVGVEKLAENVRRFLNPDLGTSRYVLNLCKASAVHNEPLVQRTHIQHLKESCKKDLCQTIIYNYSIYLEARAACQPIAAFAPESKQAEDIKRLFRELIYD